METTKSNQDTQGTLERFLCPNCSGAIQFSSNSQTMICPYCDCEFDIDTLTDIKKHSDKRDFQFDEYTVSSGTGDWKETEKSSISAYTCSSCAGEIVTDNTTVASKCPYCDSPIVVVSDLEGTYRPDIVLPFKIEKQQAKDQLKVFCSNKKLLPDFFLDENRIEDIQGIYVPFWIFSCGIDGTSTFNANRIQTWSDSRYRYTKTSTYVAYRDGIAIFDKIPADGSMKMDDALMDSIEPFVFEESKPFNTGYLSGYIAQKYDVGSKDVESRVKSRINDSMTALFQQSVVGYTSVYPKTLNIDVKDVKVEYALLPVWLLNTKYKDKNYVFAMNGQTGKFVGQLPIDQNKVLKYFMFTFIIVLCVLLVLSKIGGII